MNPRPYVSYLLLAASMALVGTYVGLSKPLVAVVPVFVLAWLRFGIAALAMLPWTLPARNEAPPTRADRWQLFLMSFFGNFLFSICMLAGIARTSATAAGMLLACLPAAVAVLSWVFLAERPTPRVLLAVALAIGGIAVLQFARPGNEPDRAATFTGNLLILGAVACEAIYVIFSRRLSATHAPLRIAARINLWGLALITPLGLWQARGFAWTALDAPLWALLVFYALAASLFAVWLWMLGMRRVPAQQAGVFTVALPIAATAVGVGWLGEAFTLLHALALLLAVAGVVLIASAPAQRRPPRA